MFVCKFPIYSALRTVTHFLLTLSVEKKLMKDTVFQIEIVPLREFLKMKDQSNELY